MREFNYLKQRERKSQSFDRENIKLKKAGKEFNVYDKIQAGREDTEIYPTLEKYGCIDRMILDKRSVYTDFTTLKGLRGMHEQVEMANQMFENLPIEVRQKFNNDAKLFAKDGEKYIKTLIDEENEKIKKAKQLQEQSKANYEKAMANLAEGKING